MKTSCKDVDNNIHRFIIWPGPKTNKKNPNKEKNDLKCATSTKCCGGQRSSNDGEESIYAAASLTAAGVKSFGGASGQFVLLTYDADNTLKGKKSWMRKNLGISPEETEADQSSVRRLSLADSRYIFSIRVPRSKGDEQICSPLCLPSPFGRVVGGMGGWGGGLRTDCGLFCITANCHHLGK